jgi:lipopolysaccharide biosynthesis protein
MDLLAQIQLNRAPGPDYEEDAGDISLPAQFPVRLITYYLPQFHPIPENDLWWGKGFTEWTNVTKALPRFVGHYQPRLPGGLGFYDLRLVENLRQQAMLAKRHGIGGFCFHYYWFGGRRLLDTPLELLLSHPDIGLPFCINWANGGWTRTWDGCDKMVLIEQKHSAEDDLAIATALEPALRDPRYIRINGRPILMLYRPGLLPDAVATVARWRQHFVNSGIGDPYLVMPQAFGDDDPNVFNMDAAAGFPPHKFGWHLPSIAASLRLLDPRYRGRVASYEAMAQGAMAFRCDEYKLFHGVCPGWDNDARRPGRGITFVGSSPQKYGLWLENACRKALQASSPDERIVFVNAWNEWAEGAHLEPDLHYGYAYLRETARVLNKLALSVHGKPALDAVAVDGDFNGAAARAPGILRRAIRKARYRGADAAEYFANAIRPS